MFSDTLLHGGLRLVSHVNQWNKCIVLGVTVHFLFRVLGLFHDRFRLFKFADSFIDCFIFSCGNFIRFPF